MDFILPFKQALNNPAGDFLIFLLICCAISLAFYAYFWLRFARHKNLTKQHFSHFKRIEKQLKDVEFVGQASADIFGKKQVVSLPDGRYGKSLIFYPELTNEPMRHRFQEYHLLLKRIHPEIFPNNMIHTVDHELINIETQYMKTNRETLVNFSSHYLDKKLSDTEKEHFLIHLAYLLEALHSLKTEQGESLYHGFLLPCSFYFSLNMVKKITHIFLANHGCVFGLSQKTFQSWLSDCYLGKYILDESLQKQIKTYYFIFSPEQRGEFHAEVTQASDFYSYAALAAYVFTESPFIDPKDINWQHIPQGWRLFLQQCLSQNPEERPINFLELKEYFDDPDLSIESQSVQIANAESKSKQLSPLKKYFQKAIKDKQTSLDTDPVWQKGYQAIKDSDFDQAEKIFDQLLQEESKNFEAQVGLALLYYQKGESKLAQVHYDEAKKIDAKRIDCFHKYLAFDI